MWREDDRQIKIRLHGVFFFFSPASLEFAEGAEKDQVIF